MGRRVSSLSMFDIFWDALPAIGTVAAWVMTISMLVLGFVGNLIPFLPGHLILFFVAVAHWLMLRQYLGVVEMEEAALRELRIR